MSRKWIILLIIVIACDGRLTDEQRKRMKEQMELHKIKRVTESQITEAAYARGRDMVNALEAIKNDSVRIDSMIKAHHGRIRWVVPGQGNIQELEQQLIDAYLSAETSDLNDNIQRMRHQNQPTDSILYTKPVVTKIRDGTERFDGVWNIWLSQKELILAMDDD